MLAPSPNPLPTAQPRPSQPNSHILAVRGCQDTSPTAPAGPGDGWLVPTYPLPVDALGHPNPWCLQGSTRAPGCIPSVAQPSQRGTQLPQPLDKENPTFCCYCHFPRQWLGAGAPPHEHSLIQAVNPAAVPDVHNTAQTHSTAVQSSLEAAC